VLRQHYLSLNVDTSPVILEVAGPHGFRPHTIVPGALWVCASAEPISLRLDSSFSYVRLSLDPRHLGRLVGAAEAEDTGVRLRRIVGLALPQVVHLLQTLRAEARDGNPNGLAFVEAVTGALGRLLIRHAGLSAPAPLPRGRLSPGVRTRTLEVIEAHLSARLTVEQLAREVGLSPAHFARAFKETMGRPPYQYLLTLRLERARQLLDQPEARLADVAFETGFADQAHFTRLFKRAYGLPPGAVMRRGRR
jgi:AraC family transcriptional regulator